MAQKKIPAIFFVFLLASGMASHKVFGQLAASKEDLQSKIQQKTQELQDINAKLQEAQKNLSETQGERQTLQKQINVYQKTINQLNLSIKEDTISIQKLNLEVDSLNYDLTDIQSSMKDKKAAVTQIILNIQKSDNENANLLAMFLKSKTLADGVMETQSLTNMHSQLKVDIENLTTLNSQYQNTIKTKSD